MRRWSRNQLFFGFTSGVAADELDTPRERPELVVEKLRRGIFGLISPEEIAIC
jgi:hypothetical protein